MPTAPHPALVRRAVPAVLALVLLAGCGGEADEPAAPDEQAAVDADEDADVASDDGSADAGTASGQTADADDPGQDAGQDGEGWCADLPADEVQAALGEVATLTGESSTVSGRDQCTYPVADAEGGGLSIYEATAGLYEQRVAQAEGLDEEAVQQPDLGAESILLNNADLTVVLDDGRELVVALQAFFTDGREVDQAAIAEGVVAVGRLAVERVG